jgi:hypothetical protein
MPPKAAGKKDKLTDAEKKKIKQETKCVCPPPITKIAPSSRGDCLLTRNVSSSTRFARDLARR